MRESHHQRRRTANLLGALALALADRVAGATDGSGEAAAREPAALVTLAHYPDQPVESLRRTLGLTHSGAVRLVDRLEASGLVVRAPAGHGRTLALRLTPAGQKRVAGLLEERLAALDPVIEPLTVAERAALRALLEKLLGGLTDDRQSARRICRLCHEEICERGARCPVDLAVG